MRRLFIVIAAFVALAGLPAVYGGDAGARPAVDPPGARKAPDQGEYAPGRIIVKMRESASDEDVERLNRSSGARVEAEIRRARLRVVRLPESLPVDEAVARYGASPNVEYAEPDFLLAPAKANDTRYRDLWGLQNTGQTGGLEGADIDAPEAWNMTTGTAKTVVAVIDEGVDITHPDLKTNIWVNKGEVPGNGVDDDGNGYVDDVNGWDFLHNDATVYDPADGDKHGTHVAGTIAAEGNNGEGVAGVTWRGKIMALKFLGPNGGYTSDAVEALDYAVANGAGISNNSWGGGGPSQALREAIDRAGAAGHLFVAAAGNSGTDNDATPFYPAAYGSPSIISVAATGSTDALASFSNYGSTSVDLAAPGVSILSTLPGGKYGYYSGTSMAAPHVAGACALLRGHYPALGVDEVKALILQSADRRSGLKGKMVSGGRLNAYGALARGSTVNFGPVPNTAPRVAYPRPIPGSKTRDRTPTIRAKVWDRETDLRKAGIKLFVNGKSVGRFSYNRRTDRLAYTSGPLKPRRHTVKIVARDAAGNTAVKTWRFRVVRSGAAS